MDIGLHRLWRIHRTRNRLAEEALGRNFPETGLEPIFPPVAKAISEIHKMPDSTRPSSANLTATKSFSSETEPHCMAAFGAKRTFNKTAVVDRSASCAFGSSKWPPITIV
jgi:hypothetical protein